MTRPRGNPPTPSAASIDKHPLGITLTGTSTSRLPSRMIAPLPWSFSICDIAAASYLSFSSVMSHLGGGNFESGPARFRRACGADRPGFAPGKRIARVPGLYEVWSLPLDSPSRHHFLPISLVPLETRLSLTTVLRVVVSQPHLRRLLAFLQHHPFRRCQVPQPRYIPSPIARLGELLFESLTFQAA